MNRHRLAAAAVIILETAALSTLSACAKEYPPTTQGPSVRAFCEPFLKFFQEDLTINDVSLRSADNLDAKISDLDSVACNYAGKLDNPVRAIVGLESPQSDVVHPDAAQREVLGYKRLPGYSVDIWIRDNRIKESTSSKGSLDLAVAVDNWHVSLQILAADKSLEMTDEQVSRAAELLIERTESVTALG
ncbi:hypothetical protein [Nocardia cyriacigeorgica]|jgi:hypothetical protein|uniref:hypothetical protein n=1 Tax=Nocardia cyriacigeorgica TaxID=135487 RepID=UPI001107CBAA|nr:hypothetical protein [Nocardia cyriacigeorgica]MBF6325375.1 hypothetical protein [Nocardia cyriacigeorgica]TLF54653.1 hypothetical protein FEK31_23730 [Nocardia cyriacigeorgica]